MDRASGTFLPDRLLLLCELCALAIFISVKYSFVLHDQDMFLLPRCKRWWYALEHVIGVTCHQPIV